MDGKMSKDMPPKNHPSMPKASDMPMEDMMDGMMGKHEDEMKQTKGRDK